jgi:butyrate kinase
MNLICCHLGGGVTVAAHRHGRAFCVNDTVNGDGPMAPTRSGWVPATDLIKLCFSGKYTEKELYDRIVKSGGIADHLGTSDMREVTRRIENGDKYAELIYNAFIYQVAKAVGGCACALKGKVDAIIITGGIANSEDLVEKLSSYISWIAPISVQAGEFEMEALAAGAIRGMEGEEPVKEYTGIPVWDGFHFGENS